MSLRELFYLVLVPLAGIAALLGGIGLIGSLRRSRDKPETVLAEETISIDAAGDGAQSHCPGCGGLLEKKPKRKTKCPHCGQYMRVRRGQLFTEEQLSRMKEEGALEGFIYRWVALLSDFGITREDLERKRETYAEGRERRASWRDAVWSLLNEAAVEAMKEGDPHDLKTVYRHQAAFAVEEGRDPKRLLAESHKWGLRIDQRLGFEEVEIIGSDEGSCDACRAMSGQLLSIEDALEQLPIPTQCEKDNGWCRCRYQPARLDNPAGQHGFTVVGELTSTSRDDPRERILHRRYELVDGEWRELE